MSKLGHEIIGVDNDMQKVENLKDKLSYTICIDATDELTSLLLLFLRTKM